MDTQSGLGTVDWTHLWLLATAIKYVNTAQQFADVLTTETRSRDSWPRLLHSFNLMAHDTSAHSHLFTASSVIPFSSMSKRIREHVADNQQISAKSKPIRATMKQEQDPTACGKQPIGRFKHPTKVFQPKIDDKEMVQKLMLSTKCVCHKEASQQSLTIKIWSKFFGDCMWAALVLSESHDKFQRVAMDHSGPRTQVLVEAV